MVSRARKVTLYRGQEKVSELSPPNAETNRQVVKLVLNELRRTPILTHGVFRDRAGFNWRVERNIGLFQRMKIYAKAK